MAAMNNGSGFCLILLAGLLWSQVLPAGEFRCALQTLKSAQGVIGQEHKYTFTGACSDSWVTSKKSGVFSSQTTTAGYHIAVNGRAVWKRATGYTREALELSGDVEGERQVTAICTRDPFLTDSPEGQGACSDYSPAVNVSAGKAYAELTAPRLWFEDSISTAVAQALSQSHSSSSAPPPPPPKPEPKTGQILPWKLFGGKGPVEIEAEERVSKKKFQVAGGRVAIQSMQSFGSDWSGGAQLFWSGGAPGAVLDLEVPVPRDGRYTVELYLTRAPDYGDLEIEVDGKPAETKFVGYGPVVGLGGAVVLGNFQLAAGARRISLMIAGKAEQSTGYFAGIDRIRLLPIASRH